MRNRHSEPKFSHTLDDLSHAVGRSARHGTLRLRGEAAGKPLDAASVRDAASDAQSPRRGASSIARRSAGLVAPGLHPFLRVRLGVGTEDLVGQLLLLRRHRVVQVLEGRDELLQMLGMRLGDLLV
jgi:hypothetical protein